MGWRRALQVIACADGLRRAVLFVGKLWRAMAEMAEPPERRLGLRRGGAALDEQTTCVCSPPKPPWAPRHDRPHRSTPRLNPSVFDVV